ncbi:MAG: ATP-grasp domain-containing protein [Deltaproteobacteria bacterium]|nr:MAG: ATP-grasp domain-containing protein [Deltaproteobacteria bacterium]
MNVTVLRESWQPHPLAWIHRAEARFFAEELRRAGYAARLVRFRDDSISDLPSGLLVLRLSDPVMLAAVQTLTRAAIPFLGPSAAAMERCYDKYEAYRVATARGVDCPATALASEASITSIPMLLKPRRGSDSIGVRLLRDGRIPARARTDRYITQQYVRGVELTVAVFRERAGMPLRIFLPQGMPYSFFRKYLRPAPRAPLADIGLAERVRRTALEIAKIFGVDWAARIDLIHEMENDRLRFLECDVAPLVSANSAFAASLEAAGIGRAEQLQMLLSHRCGLR